jgi:rhamnosyl/mannosyltransferase
MRIHLEREIQRRSLCATVHLIGGVSKQELVDHFAAASVFVLPSLNRAEAFGIALLEAQATGLPVIGTDVGTGTTEAFLPGMTGLLVPPDDVPALIDALTTLLDRGDLRTAMGEAGRRFAFENHSIDAMATRLRSIYHDLFRIAEPRLHAQISVPNV